MSSTQASRAPLASVDAAWLHMDEPTNPMVITVALFFDAPLGFKQLRALVTERLLSFARFRQRVADGRGAAPHWEDDPRFALEAHVHRVGLPGAGGDADLRELVSDLVSTPLDPTRPLWQLYLVERYGAGCVLVMRVHHCMADGVALGQIIAALMDRPTTPPVAANGHVEGVHGVIDNAFEAIGAAVRGTEQLFHSGWELVSHPERALHVISGGAAVLGKLALMGPDAPSILKGRLGPAKGAAWSAPIRLEAVKAAGKSLEGTLNDVVLVAVAGALRRYMEDRGAAIPGRGLRAMVPVNLLPPGAKPDGGNHFGLVYVGLPVAVEDPGERMACLRREMAAIKASPEAYIGYGVVGMLGAMPSGIEHAALEALGSMASMVITNVPGPRAHTIMAGQLVRRAMFWVPEAAGIGLGLSILSYAGTVQLGVLADLGLVPDPQALADAFDAEMAALVG